MNLAEIIEPHPADRVAFRSGGEDVTYSDVRRRRAAVRRALAARSIGHRARVGLVLGATVDFAVAYLGVLGAGAVAVPLNPSSPIRELDRELRTAGTSAAILTHGSLLANIEQMELRVGLGATADDIGLLVVPPFHILGLNVILGVQLYAGSRLVLIERFEPARALELIAEERVTILAGVPQIFSALAEVPGATGDELTTVRLACSGAAPLDPAVARKFEERFGVKLWRATG